MLIYPVINHIALYVYNLAKSTAFYSTVLGFPQIPEPFKDGRHSWFQISEQCQLLLIEGAEEIYTHSINTHLSFSTVSIEAFIANLEYKNVDFFDAFKNKNVINIRPDGIRQIFFQDLDGYWLEINNEGIK